MKRQPRRTGSRWSIAHAIRLAGRLPLMLRLLLGLATVLGTPAAVAADSLNGSVSGPISATAPSTDLTAEGTACWWHWYPSATGVERKAACAAGLPANPLSLLAGTTAGGYLSTPTRHGVSWGPNDGTPTAGATDVRRGIYTSPGGVGKGFVLTVPADTTGRTLVVYLGGYQASGEISASLDGVTWGPQTVGDAAGPFDRSVTFTYQAASAGKSLTVTYRQTTSGGNTTLQAATLTGGGAPPGLELPFEDDFDDGDRSGWLVADQTNRLSQWGVASGSLQQTQRVESTESFDQSYHLGSIAYLASGFGLTDYRFSAEAEYLATGLADDIGIVFRYQDANNFYRLSVNGRYGFTRLEKRVNGVFSPLATDSRGYTRGEVMKLEIEVRRSKILVWRKCGRTATVDPICLDAEPLFALEDGSLSAGTVGLYTQDQARFDNILVDSPSDAAVIVLASPLAHLTTSGVSFQPTAVVLNAPDDATVEFSLNGSLAPGNYELVAVLRDGSGDELARDTNTAVGVGGEYLVSIGDSISNGSVDKFTTDNLSLSRRIIGLQGYQARLTDLLDETGGLATNLAFNEGIGGDTSNRAAYLRVDSILLRHQDMDTALVQLGTNDALGSMPAGQGCSITPADPGCQGTFWDNMTRLVKKLVDDGVTPVVALPPPAWTSSDPWTSSVNSRIQEYISVIRGKPGQSGWPGLSGIALGPDFFAFFMPSATENFRSLFADTLHPNGLGHRVMSYLWHNALYPGDQRTLPFVLRNLSVSTGTLVQQNLLESGNSYYIDADFRLASVPSMLEEGRWIMTANAIEDRNSTAANYLTFVMERNADVYVAYDLNATTLPTWLPVSGPDGWEPQSESDVVTTTNTSCSTLKLYRKFFATGAVVNLGGNSGSLTLAGGNYVVIVVERP